MAEEGGRARPGVMRLLYASNLWCAESFEHVLIAWMRVILLQAARDRRRREAGYVMGIEEDRELGGRFGGAGGDGRGERRGWNPPARPPAAPMLGGG